MGDSKLKSVMLCEPEHKNDYNVVFGGLIMEKCVDLACINTYHYCKSANVPVCTHIDDVVFLKSVNIGDLLFPLPGGIHPREQDPDQSLGGDHGQGHAQAE